MKTKKKIIEVKEDDYRTILREALERAYKHERSGWRLPIYVEEDGTLHSNTSWLSQGSWQPSKIEIDSVGTWAVHYIESPSDEDVDYVRDSIVDFSVDNFKFENSQYKVVLI